MSQSSLYFTIAICLLAVTSAMAKYLVLTGERERFRKYLPNWMSIGLAFVIPTTVYGTATLIGAITGHIWQKKRPKGYASCIFAVAAGLMAGEGLAGVVGAGLEIAGIGGRTKGTNIGCAGQC